MVEAVVEVVNPAVPRLQRVVDVQRVERRTLELALIQPRVELEFGQRLFEAVAVDDDRRVGFTVVGLGHACAEERCHQQEIFSHGRTPAWRRC
ncbi:hypothetical protein D3C87_1964960 [compost metagenome]